MIRERAMHDLVESHLTSRCIVSLDWLSRLRDGKLKLPDSTSVAHRQFG